MLQILIIDSTFIREWAPRYDASEHDEEEYHKLVSLVPNEIFKTGTISRETFGRIYHWKAHRAINKVEWHKFDPIYAPRFRLAFSDSVPWHHKLPILLWSKEKLEKKLPVAQDRLCNIRGEASGIGVPVASAVLHFAYPSEFPIIDIRTVEVLYFCGCLKSTRTHYMGYDPFQDEMLKLAKEQGHSLREIDKALFAYHKNKLQREIKLPLDARRKDRQRAIDTKKRVKERRSLSYKTIPPSP